MRALSFAVTLFTSLAVAAEPALAQTPTLRPQVTVSGEVVTLGDLVENAGPAGLTALFQAPEAGEGGTIQAWRVVEAARGYGLSGIQTIGVREIQVWRAGRPLGEVEVAELVAREAMRRLNVAERERLQLTLERASLPQRVLVAEDATPRLDRFLIDSGSGRFEATLVVAGQRGDRVLARLSGVAQELVDMVRLRRQVARGETINASDLLVERVARPRGAGEVVASLPEAVGFAARRTLPEGSTIRPADIERPRVVNRNDPVTIVFEAGRILVTARGRAMEAGAVGDIVDVQNTASRRTLQGTIVAPGKIAINAAGQRRVAAAANQTNTRN